MNILVLIAGVSDNRYPLHDIQLQADGEILESGQTRRILSPFDEGALELALKLRDKNEATKVNVLVMGGPNEEALARSIAAYKPDSLKVLSLEPFHPWDSALTARQVGSFIKQNCPDDSLVLIGREFGDLDEGSISIMVACELGRPYFSLTQFAEWQGDDVRLMRERGLSREWLAISGEYLATVTNDKRNKLRHPLMKNVMMAKRQSIEVVRYSGDSQGQVIAASLMEPENVNRSGKCEMLGGSIQEQAQIIARYLQQVAG